MDINNIPTIIQKHPDNIRIVWDDDNLIATRELVYVGGFDCWETRWIDGFKQIIATNNFNEALNKLINP